MTAQFLHKAVFQFPYKSHLPRDVSEFSLSFRGPEDGAPLRSAIDSAAELSFSLGTGAPDISTGLGAYMSGAIDRTLTKIVWYTSDGGLTGPPVESYSFTMPNPASDSDLPLQVALCASYKGTESFTWDGSAATRSPAKRRGRIYFGPLNISGGITSTQGYPLPSTAFMTDLYRGIFFILEAVPTDFAPIIRNGVYVGAHPDLGGYTEISSGWVDNRWDTQRRREVAATARVDS